MSRRKAAGGHDVEIQRLIDRFPRTQKAIAQAVTIADASILVDNSRQQERAFTVARIQAKKESHLRCPAEQFTGTAGDSELVESCLPEAGLTTDSPFSDKDIRGFAGGRGRRFCAR